MRLRDTALLRLVGVRIPMLLFVGPRVVDAPGGGEAIEIPLTWRTRNHLIGAMYFGALCAGADLAGGFPAARLILGRHRDVRLVFGEMRAEFLKRADGDVLFVNESGEAAAEAVERAAATGERVTVPVEVVATVPKRYGSEPVARFSLTLSVKRKDAPGSARPGRGAGEGGAESKDGRAVLH